MKLSAKLVRVVAVVSSLTLLVGYVIYTQSSATWLRLETENASVSLIAESSTEKIMSVPFPTTMMSGSKSISHPIFSTRKVSSAEVDGLLHVRADRRIMSGSKSGAVELPMPEFLNVTFADFGISLDPFLGFQPPSNPFEETLDATVKTGADDPFGAPASKP